MKNNRGARYADSPWGGSEKNSSIRMLAYPRRGKNDRFGVCLCRMYYGELLKARKKYGKLWFISILVFDIGEEVQGYPVERPLKISAKTITNDVNGATGR